MYLIRRAKSFEKAYKKLKKSGIKELAFKDLGFVINSLAEGRSLPTSYKDHSLNGKIKYLRECHIKGDLLLIYKIEKDKLILVLVNIGSHSQLFN